MGLHTFLRVILRNWWLIVLSVVLTAGSTWFFVSRKEPIYRATTTVELKPSTTLADPRQITDAISVLDKRTTINTLARKATGSSMQEQVAQRLSIPVTAVKDSSLSAVVLPETNLIEIRAQSTSPELAAAISNTVAETLLGQGLDKVLQMEIIDLAEPPTSPIEPQPTRLIVLGIFSGLILGIMFALLEYALQMVLGATERPAAAPLAEPAATLPLAAPQSLAEDARHPLAPASSASSAENARVAPAPETIVVEPDNIGSVDRQLPPAAFQPDAMDSGSPSAPLPADGSYATDDGESDLATSDPLPPAESLPAPAETALAVGDTLPEQIDSPVADVVSVTQDAGDRPAAEGDTIRLDPASEQQLSSNAPIRQNGASSRRGRRR